MISEADARAWAATHGYALVPQPVANWHPLFIALLQQNRVVFAVKLWAEITAPPGGFPDLRAAAQYVESLRNHTRGLPQGTEHPDLPEARLTYYTGAIKF